MLSRSTSDREIPGLGILESLKKYLQACKQLLLSWSVVFLGLAPGATLGRLSMVTKSSRLAAVNGNINE
jgi:hypothetical protein